MRICLIHRDIHQITRGGICTLYRALAKRLAAQGHEVTVITPATPHPVRTPDAKLIILRRTDDLSAHRRAVTAALTGIRPDGIDCSSWEAETLDYLQLPPQHRVPVVVRGDLSARTMEQPPSPPPSRISSTAPTGSSPSPPSPPATSQPPTASPPPRSSATASNETGSTPARCSRPATDTGSSSTAVGRRRSRLRCCPAGSCRSAPGRTAALVGSRSGRTVQDPKAQNLTACQVRPASDVRSSRSGPGNPGWPTTSQPTVGLT